MATSKHLLTGLALIFLADLAASGEDTLSNFGFCFGQCLPCQQQINFRYANDTMEIYGTIPMNCCGSHFTVISNNAGTIHIATIDTGQLCTCQCDFNFHLKIPIADTDTIIEFNGTNYNIPSLINSVDENGQLAKNILIYPNPATGYIGIEIYGGLDIAAITITDVRGKMVKDIFQTPAGKSIVSLSGMPSGLYLVSFAHRSGQTIVKKVAVN